MDLILLPLFALDLKRKPRTAKPGEVKLLTNKFIQYIAYSVLNLEKFVKLFIKYELNMISLKAINVIVRDSNIAPIHCCLLLLVTLLPGM